MTRFLLTLLALLTGLAASGNPAQARMCVGGEAEIGAVASVIGGDRVTVQGQGVAAPAARGEWRQRSQSCPKPQRKQAYILTVQLGIDRARE